MKKIIVTVILLMIAGRFFASTYNVLDFGAKPDGRNLATTAIQKTIDFCAAQGGGVVIVPTGNYLVGTLNLRSNVEFHFEHGARLIATTDLSNYQKHNDELAGVFYTEDASHVAITGGGIVFGQGLEFMYADSAKVIGHDDRKWLRQGDDFRKVSNGVGDGPLYPKERFHQMIVFSNCTDVVLSDFACIDAPYWTFLIVHCNGVRVSGLRIDNNLLIPNSDGLDIISSSNVNVSDCNFSCGDDAIVLAGYDWHFGDPGFKRINRPSHHINISNCILRSRSSAIRIGGWDQNPMSDYFFSNIIIYESNAGINFNVRDSGGIENVFFNNIRIETRLHTGDWWGNGEPIRISAMRGVPDHKLGVIRNVFFNHISCDSENAIVLLSSDESALENVSFTNFDFHLRQGALDDVAGGNIDLRPNIVDGKSFYQSDIPVVLIEHAKNIRFDGGTITWGDMTKPYYTHAISASDVDGLKILNVSGSASPSNPKMAPVLLKNCRNVQNTLPSLPAPVDSQATSETKSLFAGLLNYLDKGIMLAHQDDTAYGFNRYTRKGYSDIKKVAGDYPAVAGWDLGHIENGADYNLDSVYFSDMKLRMREVYERGGINTLSWHVDNIATGGSAWDCALDTVVRSVLPGGANHARFLTELDRLAAFFNDLKDSKGKSFPVLFRPYHEHTGSWFWWGAQQCTPDEYNRLYRMTVRYLRDEKNVHNLLYSFSSADISTEQEFIERYPGDEWVDIVGFDCYFSDDKTDASLARYRQQMDIGLNIVTSFASAHNKIPAITETGLEGLGRSNYFTEILLPAIEPYKISYVLLWRNAWNRTDHFYAPYPGHVSAPDFIKFINHSKILMNKDISSIYKSL
ncbi:MAG: hypothetical protein LBR48_06210 [Dysgonamonadaceae bacterium]|jgi:polygalacturonase|nr:hypothetical protein [Dysgonamonadaceae bacterium]